jgi:tetratricopeptide (TPR) repeat protein
MVKYLLTLFLVPVLGAAQSPVPQDAKAVLARAEVLYYEAKFKESLELLLPLDAALQHQGGELRDRINVKLQMALDHIGLNEIAEAKLRFADVSALDSNYSLDPQQFSPKVMAIFEEAKSELGQGQCRTFCVKLQEQLDTGNSESLDLSGQSTDSWCGCLTEFAADVARISYKQGVDAYNRDLFTEALQKFRTALRFEPGHELASQYIELTENKARLAVDQLSLDWRRNFDAGQYAVAADRYRKLLSLSVEAGAPALEQMRGEYRKALPPLLGSWNLACQASDLSTMASVRTQATQLLPDPVIGEDILAQMKTCIQNRDTPK